jgi:hypothetical protein
MRKGRGLRGGDPAGKEGGLGASGGSYGRSRLHWSRSSAHLGFHRPWMFIAKDTLWSLIPICGVPPGSGEERSTCLAAAHPQAAVEVAGVESRDENRLILLRREKDG